MRVLLADDQVWLRSALRLLLEHEPNIEVVGEVVEAEALLTSIERLRPDLVLLDWELPGMKAEDARWHMVRHLRSIDPSLYIVALVSSAMSTVPPLHGVDDYVSKADPPECLIAALQRASRTRPLSSPILSSATQTEGHEGCVR